MIFSVEDKLHSMGHALDGLGTSVRAALLQATVDLARGAKDEWVRLAQSRLKTSREIYINGLRQADSFHIAASETGVAATIQLVGVMPNNFEFGVASFDMKTVRPGWLGGGKAKTAADGSKYVVIPFRHSTSEDSRFGYTGKAAQVTPPLKDQLKQVVRQYGLNTPLTASPGEVATRRIPNNAPVHPYLQGLQKTEYAQPTASGGMKRSSTLTTFRVLSENSDPDSWIHPGLKAQNLLQEVDSWVDKAMRDMINVVVGS